MGDKCFKGAHLCSTTSSPDLFQLGLIVFSTKAHIVISLNQCSTEEILIEAIDEVQYQPGSTNISGSLWLMREVFFTKDNGARTGYSRIGIILIAEESSLGEDLLSKEAQLTHESGITMIVLGIGSWVYYDVSILG